MDFVTSQVDRIRQQLAGLTPSQKMLSACLVAIMVMTLAWWGRYAGQAEWEPAIDQVLAPEDLRRADVGLTAAGIEHRVGNDGKVLVPADQKLRAVANLYLGNAGPRKIESGFDEMVKQLTAWDGQDRQSAFFNRAKELTIERVIAAMPPVLAASVTIVPAPERQIGRNVDPTAAVFIQTREPGGKARDVKLATAVANFVSGALVGLTPGRVRVMVNDRAVAVPDAGSADGGGMAGADVMELRAAFEQQAVDKIRNLYSHIEGLNVSVTAEVNNATEQLQTRRFNKDDSFVTEQSIKSKTQEETAPAAAAAEPGFVPNGGASIGGPASAGPGRSSTTGTDDTQMFVAAGGTESKKVIPAGQATVVGATVRVPQSFFVRLARQKQQLADPAKKDKEPDPAAVERVMAAEMAGITAAVRACTQIKDPQGVTVAAYEDLVPLGPDPANQPVVASAVSVVLGGHVKEIALGGLALASLFMMTMFVRKGTPAPVAVAAPAAPGSAAATAAAAPGANRLDLGEALAGEVAGGNLTLDGLELDDDALKAQQMLAQVTDLVGENPETAANLIKRWMNQR